MALLAAATTARGQGGNSILTAASGGLAIPADTAGGAYTTLTGPVYQEGAPGDVSTGTIVLNVPSGFVFDASAAVTVLVNGGSSPLHNINDLANGSVITAAVTTTNITITITAKSSNGSNNKLTWQNVRVRPTAGSPLASGNITKSGTAGVTGVTGSSNFGTLREVVGVANTVLVTGFPGSTTAGVPGSVTVTLKDQFGSPATNYTGTIHFTSTDAQADLPANYTFAAADGGVHTFSGGVTLKTAGIRSITARDTLNSLLSGTESSIAVSPSTAAQLVFVTQPGSAVYGSALSSQPVLKSLDAYGNDSAVGLAASKIVALSLTGGSGPLAGSTSLDIGTSAGNGIVSFSGLSVNSAGIGKQLTASASGLSSAVSSPFVISQASLTVSANSGSRIYGAANPAMSGSISGIQNGDNITAAYLTSATAASPVGSYGIVPSLNDPDGKLGNYSVTSNNGTLTVNPAVLTGAADNKSRAYGATNPVFTATYSGFVNGEDASVIGGTLTGSSPATTSSPAGSYSISISGQSAANYTIQYVGGTLSVIPAALLVTANDASRAYGQTNPVFNATITGFVNGDDATALVGAPAFNTAADTNSPVGTYPLEVGGVSSPNYSITFSNGTLSVTAYALTVVADDQSRAYGADNPALTGSLSGLQNGDNVTATYSSSADASSAVGAYSIVTTLSDPDSRLTNYSVTISNGTLTVTPADLTITAHNETRTYGSDNPALTGSISGIQNGDNITADYSTAAASSSPVGSYDIVPSMSDPDGKLANYNLTMHNGSLTVQPAALTVSADHQSRVFGASNPTLTGSLTGVQNGDNITAGYSTAADSSSAAGTYDIVPGLNDPDNKLANYNVTILNGMLTVTAASSLNSLASSLSPSAQGASVTFTATITPVAPASGTPGGDVQFFVNGVASGAPVTLAGGAASFTTASLPAGSNAVTAVYSGDGNFLGSTGNVVQVVTQIVPGPGNLTLRDNGDGTTTLEFTGGPGAQYLIQAATSLIPGNWATIGTGTADSDGKISFTDPDAGSYPWRFYRAAKP